METALHRQVGSTIVVIHATDAALSLTAAVNSANFLQGVACNSTMRIDRRACSDVDVRAVHVRKWHGQ